jgi:hypothetical protein
MGTESRMQSSIYNTPSPRHHSSPATSRRPRPHTSRSRTASRGESYSSTSDLASNSFLARKMANDEVPIGSKPLSNPELDKIRRNSLYMTFNAPQVDDYVCGLIFFVTPLRGIPHFINSGGGVAVWRKVTLSKRFFSSLTSYTSNRHVIHTC